MTDRCSIPGCRAEVEITYLDHGICTAHWNEFTAERLRMVLGIEADATAKEYEMAKKKDETPNPAPVGADTTSGTKVEPKPARRRKKTPTAATAPEGAAQATPAEPTPSPKKKRAKKDAAPEPEQATPKLAVPKPKKTREALCVFALRMAEPERTKLHQTAGPRGATRLARAVLVAAANEDVEGFKTALQDARQARG